MSSPKWSVKEFQVILIQPFWSSRGMYKDQKDSWQGVKITYLKHIIMVTSEGQYKVVSKKSIPSGVCEINY